MTDTAQGAGTVYLLHFEKSIGNPAKPKGQASHYIGWTTNLDKRLEQHRKGWSACIVKAFHAAKIGFVLAQTWEGDRHLERSLKNKKHASRFCPVCQGEK